MNATYEEMQELYKKWSEDGTIEWHCPGRHGVIRKIGRDPKTLNFLVYFFGNRCYTNKGNDVEFVHMTKVFPPPRNPWEWCGETVLFQDLKESRERRQAEVKTFKPGDEVTIVINGKRETAFVVKSNQKTVSVVVPNKGEWRATPGLLTRVKR